MTRAATFVLIMCAALATANAQTPAFRGSVDLVEVDVSVMRDNRLVPGLTARNFIVMDNGVRQEVQVATIGDQPLRVTLVLDVSASVNGPRLHSLVNAAESLVAAMAPRDQLSLVTFSHEARRLKPMGTSAADLRRALNELTGRGATALRDAVNLAVTAEMAERTRSLLLVFSDGEDTASWLAEPEVLTLVRRANSVIHAVVFDDNPFLDRVTETSGGRTWRASSDGQLDALFERVLAEMRGRYLLTYSKGSDQQRGWHDIKVSLRDARGTVTARPGYLVP